MTKEGMTRMTFGYARGKQFPIVVEWCCGVWMECATALAFREMKADAKKDGIDLIPTSGWRSFEEQKAIWLERQDPEVRATKGPAAKPGFSTHQSGRSIDIRTGLSYRRFAAGDRTAIYVWLERNAKRYGFVRDVPSEPWHWTLLLTDRKDRG